MGGVEALQGVLLQFARFHRQILVQGFQGGQLPGPGHGGEAVFRFPGALLPHPVPAEEAEEIVDLRFRHRGQHAQVHVPDGDLGKLRLLGHQAPAELQEAEKGAQIQIVFVDGGLGVALYHLMILEKIPEDLRRLVPIVHSAPRNSLLFRHDNYV